MRNRRYQDAMMISNEKVRALCAGTDSKPSSLLLQINRDLLFQLHSGDFKSVVSRVTFWQLIESFFAYKQLKSLKRKTDVALCASQNLFNFSALTRTGLRVNANSGIVFSSTSNALLYLKYFSLFLVPMKCLKYRRLKRSLNLARAGFNKRAIILYWQQLIHFRLVRKHFPKLIYFGNGSPSYGRYLCDNYWEIQHGVLHQDHPIVNPIARSRGKLIVLNTFGLKNQSFFVHLERGIDIFLPKKEKLEIALAPLRNEDNFSSFIQSKEPDTLILWHPKSAKYDNLMSLESRHSVMKHASKITSGFGTAIFDAHLLNPSALHVALSKEDLADLSWEQLTIDEISCGINEYFGTSIEPCRVHII